MCFGVPHEAIRESSVHSTIRKRSGGKPHPNLVNLIKVKRKQNSLVIITEHVSNQKTLKMAFEAENQFQVGLATVKYLMKQILEAVRFLHEECLYVHGNITLPNLYIVNKKEGSHQSSTGD